MILAKIYQANMGSEPYLKDFVRSGVLKIDHDVEDRQEFIKKKSIEVNDFFQTHPGSTVRTVAEASSMQQIINSISNYD